MEANVFAPVQQFCLSLVHCPVCRRD